jgi:hypothetical protein
VRCAGICLARKTGAHVRLLTGRGLEYDLCCPACDRAALDGDPPELLAACEGCVNQCADDDWGAPLAWRGETGIATRPEPLDTTVVDAPLPVAAADLVPVTDGIRPVWLLLTAADRNRGRIRPGQLPSGGRRVRRDQRRGAPPVGRSALTSA